MRSSAQRARDPLGLGERRVEQGADHGVAGIVHQQVQPAHARGGGLDGGGDGGDVEQVVLRAVQALHGGAGGFQHRDDGSPDAAAMARDQGALPRQAGLRDGRLHASVLHEFSAYAGLLVAAS
jgi:hypothetical protein